MTIAVGWYTTARGAGSRGMFLAVRNAMEAGTLDARFAHVFCNREPDEDIATDSFFDLARDTGAPLVTLSSVRFRREHEGARSRPNEPLPEWREAYDAEVARLVDPHGAQVGVLAGYMLIFTPPFVLQHPILNLHPALPGGPTGTWREVIRCLIRTGANENGAMIHLAIPEVDAGPVAAFCRYAIRGGEYDALWDALGDIHNHSMIDDATIDDSALFARVREAQMAYEAPLLVSALQAFADGRMRARPGHILDARGHDAAPLDLTADVEARRARRE
ncbi:MAG: phosphoglycerate transporter [Dehalococcoidia bacterium]|nr:phosphoglycerate transporter [Dehalococcoidia bacterium]